MPIGRCFVQRHRCENGVATGPRERDEEVVSVRLPKNFAVTIDNYRGPVNMPDPPPTEWPTRWETQIFENTVGEN